MCQVSKHSQCIIHCYYFTHQKKKKKKKKKKSQTKRMGITQLIDKACFYDPKHFGTKLFINAD